MTFLKMLITVSLAGLKPAQEMKLQRGIPNNEAFADLQKRERGDGQKHSQF